MCRLSPVGCSGLIPSGCFGFGCNPDGWVFRLSPVCCSGLIPSGCFGFGCNPDGRVFRLSTVGCSGQIPSGCFCLGCNPDGQVFRLSPVRCSGLIPGGCFGLGCNPVGRVFRPFPVGCSGLILTGCSGFRPLAGWVACPAGSPMMSQSPRDEGFAPYRMNSFSTEPSKAWRNGRLIPIQTEQLFPFSGKSCFSFEKLSNTLST